VPDQNFKPKKRGGVYPAEAPKEYIPSKAHIELSELWKTHLDTNTSTRRSSYSARDYSYWMALLLHQTEVQEPEMNEKTLAAFIMFLSKRMDAQGKWDGWGKVFLSVPQALKIKDGTNKFEKAWSSFGHVYKKEFQKHCNQELLGQLGNFVNRVLVFAQNRCDKKTPKRGPLQEEDMRFINEMTSS